MITGAGATTGNITHPFGNPQAGTTYGAATLVTIPDGTSNTVFFAEVYGSCYISPNPPGNNRSRAG